MEHYTYSFRDGDGNVIRWMCAIEDPDRCEREWVGCGPTEAAAVLDAYARAAEENDEARLELGVLLGVRGDGMGGRPSGS